MDDSPYKHFTASKGFEYNPFHSEPAPAIALGPGKPTVVLVHGFGIASRDWRRQIFLFPKEPHQIIALDLLGYSATKRPNDLGQDTIDIFDNGRFRRRFSSVKEVDQAPQQSRSED
ncbi:hypothetical protein V5O48_019394 [Marasmius crinis-equi]|uniref:AB hydrolase-1 domain-containing protein n=1 Tax=Marasmius crinis-equi TaxID=585013 RepID=A0ABR3EIJ3_9AGAR